MMAWLAECWHFRTLAALPEKRLSSHVHTACTLKMTGHCAEPAHAAYARMINWTAIATLDVSRVGHEITRCYATVHTSLKSSIPFAAEAGAEQRQLMIAPEWKR